MVRGAVVSVALIVAAYLLAAAVLARMPVEGMPPVRDGVEVFVCTNGIHTDLVLPAVSKAMDWTTELARSDFPGADPWATHFSFGWGDRAFYLETRRWEDVSPFTAVSAVFGGGPTVMHVYAMYAPVGSPDCGAVMLRDQQYHALVDYVRGSFRRDGAGAVMPLRGSGYGPTDLFYEAVGRYSLYDTCNEWTAKGLRAAGVTVGAWTPFEGGVMRWVR